MEENNFAEGSMTKHIVQLAIPMIVAQLINVLYNVVDRIYIGRIPDVATYAMGGLGICLPLISIIMAFANLVGMGGGPLCSIARGRHDHEEAEAILGNSFILLILFSIVLTIVIYLFKEPILWAFGASENNFQYANSYISIYLIGTIFVLVELGLNSFINAQGFGKIGMMTVLLGAVTNIILDPIFIFGLNLGVSGAAIATVFSQMVSAIWTVQFLTGKRTILRIKKDYFKLNGQLVKKILTLGTSGFCMQLTNSIVSIVCNVTLSTWGGDLYITIMTIINSIREVAQLFGQGFANASQPVLGYNYGAGEYKRLLKGIKIITISCFSMMFITWAVINIFPRFIFSIFTTDSETITLGVRACKLYFSGFFMMSFQMSGQSVAIGLGKSKQAIFFSIFRKVIIVAPLTVILPYFMGTDGVFIAEAISNFIGGSACYITMWLTIGKDIRKNAKLQEIENG